MRGGWKAEVVSRRNLLSWGKILPELGVENDGSIDPRAAAAACLLLTQRSRFLFQLLRSLGCFLERVCVCVYVHVCVCEREREGAQKLSML